MGTRVMGVVGMRRSSAESMDNAVRTRAPRRHNGASSLLASCEGTSAVKLKEAERNQVVDPARKRAVFFPLRYQSERVTFRYHTQEGTNGEALGYMTARNVLFLATPSMFPLGTALILEPVEAGPAPAMTGKVTAICPGPDEFGFPPGVGLYVADESDVSQELMMPRGAQSGD